MNVQWENTMDKGNKAEDMIIRWFGGQTGYNDIKVILEVKNSWHSGDLCIEEDSVREQGKKGWIYTTKSDSVLFVDYENEQALLIETIELRKQYELLKDNYQLHEQQTSRNGSIWTSTHRYLPFNKFSYTFLKYHQRYI